VCSTSHSIPLLKTSIFITKRKETIVSLNIVINHHIEIVLIVAPNVLTELHIEYLSANDLYFRGQPCIPIKCIGKKVIFTPKKNKLKNDCIIFLL
jgi:hypothetical protein